MCSGRAGPSSGRSSGAAAVDPEVEGSETGDPESDPAVEASAVEGSEVEGATSDGAAASSPGAASGVSAGPCGTLSSSGSEGRSRTEGAGASPSASPAGRRHGAVLSPSGRRVR